MLSCNTFHSPRLLISNNIPAAVAPPPPYSTLLYLQHSAKATFASSSSSHLEVQPTRLLTVSQRVDSTGSHRNDGLPKCRPAFIPSACHFLRPPPLVWPKPSAAFPLSPPYNYLYAYLFTRRAVLCSQNIQRCPQHSSRTVLGPTQSGRDPPALLCHGAPHNVPSI
ncbi:hypothetical protein BDZ89DRAFT_561556 [Hymenopellis radicata]|nr:hypothetical protein BDZ89DRAFT_561556 [Hymenopellis radicata]